MFTRHCSIHITPSVAVPEENIGGQDKNLTTFFSRRPQNTGQNYQINHSNHPKSAPCITAGYLGEDSGLGGGNCPRPNAKLRLNPFLDFLCFSVVM